MLTPSFAGMSNAILVEGLQKRFGSNTALAGVDLTVPEGSVLGLLGPNGAGKTTVVRILTTLLQPDGGRDSSRAPGQASETANPASSSAPTTVRAWSGPRVSSTTKTST